MPGSSSHYDHRLHSSWDNIDHPLNLFDTKALIDHFISLKKDWANHSISIALPKFISLKNKMQFLNYVKL